MDKLQEYLKTLRRDQMKCNILMIKIMMNLVRIVTTVYRQDKHLVGNNLSIPKAISELINLK